MVYSAYSDRYRLINQNVIYGLFYIFSYSEWLFPFSHYFILPTTAWLYEVRDFETLNSKITDTVSQNLFWRAKLRKKARQSKFWRKKCVQFKLCTLTRITLKPFVVVCVSFFYIGLTFICPPTALKTFIIVEN